MFGLGDDVPVSLYEDEAALASKWCALEDAASDRGDSALDGCMLRGDGCMGMGMDIERGVSVVVLL